MENASRALIIAGGMLIAMLVVSLLVWGFTSISAYQKEKAQKLEIEVVLDFNKKFEAYDKASIKGYQLISLVNLAVDTNGRYTEENGYKPIEIRVLIDEELRVTKSHNSRKSTRN